MNRLAESSDVSRKPSKVQQKHLKIQERLFQYSLSYLLWLPTQ